MKLSYDTNAPPMTPIAKACMEPPPKRMKMEAQTTVSSPVPSPEAILTQPEMVMPRRPRTPLPDRPRRQRTFTPMRQRTFTPMRQRTFAPIPTYSHPNSLSSTEEHKPKFNRPLTPIPSHDSPSSLALHTDNTNFSLPFQNAGSPAFHLSTPTINKNNRCNKGRRVLSVLDGKSLETGPLAPQPGQTNRSFGNFTQSPTDCWPKVFVSDPNWDGEDNRYVINLHTGQGEVGLRSAGTGKDGYEFGDPISRRASRDVEENAHNRKKKKMQVAHAKLWLKRRNTEEYRIQATRAGNLAAFEKKVEEARKIVEKYKRQNSTQFVKVSVASVFVPRPPLFEENTDTAKESTLEYESDLNTDTDQEPLPPNLSTTKTATGNTTSNGYKPKLSGTKAFPTFPIGPLPNPSTLNAKAVTAIIHTLLTEHSHTIGKGAMLRTDFITGMPYFHQKKPVRRPQGRGGLKSPEVLPSRSKHQTDGEWEFSVPTERRGAHWVNGAREKGLLTWSAMLAEVKEIEEVLQEEMDEEKSQMEDPGFKQRQKAAERKKWNKMAREAMIDYRPRRK